MGLRGTLDVDQQTEFKMCPWKISEHEALPILIIKPNPKCIHENLRVKGIPDADSRVHGLSEGLIVPSTPEPVPVKCFNFFSAQTPNSPK